jgi:hypothetical protein
MRLRTWMLTQGNFSFEFPSALQDRKAKIELGPKKVCKASMRVGLKTSG